MDTIIPSNSNSSSSDSEPAEFRTSPALKNKKIIAGLILVGLVLFFAMWLNVVTESFVYLWDEPANDFFLQMRNSYSESVNDVAQNFSNAASQGLTGIAIVLLVIWAFRREFYRVWLMFTAVAGVELLWLAVVFLIGRPRPVEVHTVGDILLPGFPSGHVMLFIAFFGSLLYLFLEKVKNRIWRLLIVVSVIALLLLISFVRLYFNTHYITDIIAGYGLGLAWTAFAFYLVDWVFQKRRGKIGQET